MLVATLTAATQLQAAQAALALAVLAALAALPSVATAELGGVACFEPFKLCQQLMLVRAAVVKLK